MYDCIQKFRQRIRALDEKSYSDFLRLADRYLYELRKDCALEGIFDVEFKLDEMQEYINFTSSRDIHDAKRKLIKDSEYLCNIMAHHEYDWDSMSTHL